MLPKIGAGTCPGLCPTEKTALWLWAGVLAVITWRAFFFPHVHTVYPIFSNAARNWLASDDAYYPTVDKDLDQYRYSPLVTALFVPLSFLPDNVGGIVWRLL